MDHGASKVRARLAAVNIMVLLAGVIGLVAVFETSKGAWLHELNAWDLKLETQFAAAAQTAALDDPADRARLRSVAEAIKTKHQACLDGFSRIERIGLSWLGGDRWVAICLDDVAIAERAIAALDGVETGAVAPDEAHGAILTATSAFTKNVSEFDPLVADIADGLLVSATVAIAATFAIVLTLSLSITRFVSTRFQRLAEVETTLSARNAELSATITLLERRTEEIQKAREQAQIDALHDDLTGLPNRKHLERKLNETREAHERIALFHIDLDRFKHINDTLGHEAGDHVLREVSEIVRNTVRESDFVARIGGDEFVVMTCGSRAPTSIEALSRRLIETLRMPIPYGETACRVSASIGVAVQQDCRASGAQLLIEADIARARAKSLGRARVELFSPSIGSAMTENKRVADEIMFSLERDDFEPFYQPQFSARTLDVVGVEALARWRRPSAGLSTPSAFAAVAEEIGVIDQIDRAILLRAHDDMLGWRRDGVQIPHVSVNISAARLRSPLLIEDFRALGEDAQRFSAELLETIYLDRNDDETAHAIDALRSTGAKIELDDFGSGHASILSLLSLQPNRLKIDRQLIAPITTEPAKRALVRSIVDMARSLGVDVVAEGVETQEHVRIARDLGCDVLQGFALARPMPDDALREFLDIEAWRNVA